MYLSFVFSSSVFVFVFFFQAEDGIRDYKVTGVQTCALPICIQPAVRLLHEVVWRHEDEVSAAGERREAIEDEPHVVVQRSEERRVGKECRGRWGPEP